MSTPSSKITVTCERPNFESERTSARPFKPLIACSTGNVICCSISSGSQCRRDRVDLYLHRGGIGKGVDRQLRCRIRAGDHENQSQRDDQKPVPQRPRNNGIQHGCLPSGIDLAATGADVALEEFGFHQEAAGTRNDLVFLKSL